MNIYMIVIHKRGRFCYVEGNDCYVIYAIFHYKMKDNRCFFSKKKLEKILKILDSKKINHKLINCLKPYITTMTYI